MICNYEYSPYLKILQFGDLVFDSEDTFESILYSVSTKTDTTEYGWGHGSYLPIKNEYQFLSEGDLSISAVFDYRLYPREQRRFIKDWIKMNILKVGRIWAISDKHLLWANAYITDYTETYEKFKGTLSIDLDFKIPEGVFHIADAHKTFLIPYNSCDVFDCVDFRDDETTCDKCCVSCAAETIQDCEDCLCECGEIERSDSLCGMNRDEVFHDFLKCGHSMKIVYDCQKAKEIFGDDTLGYKFTKSSYCKKTIAGRFYSNTIIPTDLVDVVLIGKYQNPTIDINGNKMTLEGDYEGRLHFYSDGSITLQCDGCSDEEEVDISNLQIDGDFGWTVHHGENRLIVTGVCGCGPDMAYVSVDELTY